jgi:hypothetical protein
MSYIKNDDFSKLLAWNLHLNKYMEKGISMMTKTANRRIGEILIGLGYISGEDVAHALELQKQSPKKKIGRILVETNALTDQQVFKAIELQWDEWLKGSAA